jgi:hypothetical protein
LIDYYLPHAASGAVTIEILDGHGQVVRKYSSTDQPPVAEEDLKKQLIPLYWLKPFQALSAEAGMHRWVWDLHYAAPVSTHHEYPIAAIPGDTPRLPLGPTALPGNYTVRLTADGKSYKAALVIKMDPRVKTSADGLEKKFRAEMELAASLSESSKAVLQAGLIRQVLDKLVQQSSGWVHAPLLAFQEKLSNVLGASGGAAPEADEITLSRVNGQLGILYGQVWMVDAEPTSTQAEAMAATERDAADVMKRWEALKTSDLPALNREMKQANLPELKIEAAPRQDDSSVDEE